MYNSKHTKKSEKADKRLPVQIEFNSYFSENEERRSNNLFNILTKCFKPIVDSAYSRYLNDQYAHVLHKVDAEKSILNRGQSEFEKIYERIFKKNVSKSLKKTLSPQKSLRNYSSSVTRKRKYNNFNSKETKRIKKY